MDPWINHPTNVATAFRSRIGHRADRQPVQQNRFSPAYLVECG
jgi:hypothetical protein